MSMTPYEIRLQLLSMAKDMLVDDFHTRKDSAQQQWIIQVEAAKIAGTNAPEMPPLPTYPTEEEVVKKAEQLNNFVSQTQSTPEVKITKKSNS